MKNTIKYMIGAAAGVGMYMLYEKFSPMLMKEMKKSADMMSKEADKCIENMKS